MDTAPRLLPMPTVEALENHDPDEYAAAVLLVQHGINPYNIPRNPEALDVEGYDVVTGEIRPDNTLEVRHQPWNETPPDVVQAVLAYVDRWASRHPQSRP